MPTIPLDPYAVEVAAALAADGYHVVQTWTEPVEPVDHVISFDLADGSNIHLIWDGTWRWFRYPPTGTRGTYPHLFECPTTGPLLPGRVRPTATDVVAAAHSTFSPDAARGVQP